MAAPIGRTFVEIDVDAKKYEKGIVDVKTTTKKKLTEIEKAWKGLGKKSEATYDAMRANINKNYDKIKRHSLSTADDIIRAEKAKNEKIAKINKQQFGEQKSFIDKAKKHWMALSAAAVAAIYAIGRTVQKSLSMYADWEVALNRLGNVSDETIPEMREKILSISPALGSVTELTKGYYQVLSAGVKEPLEAMDLLTTSAKMSKEATIEQAEAVKGLAALMGTYSTELTDANAAADLLYKTEALGITTVGELIPLIGNLATQAETVGLKADEMAAALAQITTTGAGTSISVTQLQSLLTALSKKFALLPPEVKKYGSATAAVKALGFQGVLKEIMRYTEGNSTALIKMLGRQEGYLALLQLSKNEFGDYSAKLKEMTDKTGAFDDAWKRYSITLTAIWDTFKNTIGKQAILIGEKLAPGIKKVIERTSKWFEANEDIITQNMATAIDAIVVAVGALATVYETLAKAQKTIAEQVNKLSEEQRESIKLTLEQSTGLAGAKAVFKLFSQAYVYWLDKFTKKEEEWTVTIGRRKKIQDEGNKTTNETTDAIKNLAKGIAAAEKESALWTKFFAEGMEDSRAIAAEVLETTRELTGAFDTAETKTDIWTLAMKEGLEDSRMTAGGLASEVNEVTGAFDTMGAKTDTITKGMIQSFKDFAGDAIDAVTSVANSAKRVATTIWSTISSIWSGLKSAIGMVGGVITFFITFPTNLRKSLEGFMKSIKELPDIIDDFFAAVDTFFENLPEIVTTFIDSVGEFVDGLVEAIPDVMDALIEELPELMDALIEGAEDFTKAIVDEIPDLIGAIMDEIPDMVTSFMEVFLPAILDMIPKVLKKILEGIPDIIKAFSASIPTVITALIDAIVDLIPVLVEEIPLIVDALIDSIIEDTPKIIAAIIEGIPDIIKALIDAIGDIVTGTTTDITIGDIIDPLGLFHHAGGIVGREGQTSRSVPAAGFAAAPRAHRGLMIDEVPIIAKRGEGIFTPAQMQALGRQEHGSSQPIHVHLNLDGREVGLAIVKDGDVIEQMDYQLTKSNRRVYA